MRREARQGQRPQSGADDYLTKLFGMRVHARVRALAAAAAAANAKAHQAPVTVAGLQVDPRGAWRG